jgi:hypothetical protein
MHVLIEQAKVATSISHSRPSSIVDDDVTQTRLPAFSLYVLGSYSTLLLVYSLDISSEHKFAIESPRS